MLDNQRYNVIINDFSKTNIRAAHLKKLLADVFFFIFSCGSPKESAPFFLLIGLIHPNLSLLRDREKPDDSSYQRGIGHLFGFRRVDIRTNSMLRSSDRSVIFRPVI